MAAGLRTYGRVPGPGLAPRSCAVSVLAGPLLVGVLCLAGSGKASGQTRAQSQAWARSMKGAAAMVSGSPALARAHFLSALKEVDSPEMRTAVALTYAAQRRYQVALGQLQALVQKQAALPQLHYWRARLLLALRRPARACDAMNLALSLGGDRPAYLVAKAIACKEARRSAEAVRSLVRAARRYDDLMDPTLYPDPTHGVLDLVFKSLATFPNPRRATVTVAHLFYRARHYREAERLGIRMQKRWGQVHEAFFLRTRCRLAAGDIPAALTWAERVVGSRPSDSASLALRAEVHLAAGHKGKAMADLERAVGLDASHAGNLSRLGALHWEQGNYGKAERLFRYALERDRSLASAHHGTALAMDRRKKYARAETHHREAIKLSPGNPVYLQSYAVFLQRHRRDAIARRHLARARKLAAVYKRFNQKLARARRFVGGFDAARALLKSGKTREALRRMSSLKGPRAPVAFLRAHADGSAGRNPLPRARVALAGLSARNLLDLSARVSVVEYRGSAGRDFPVVLRQYLLSVDPGRFR